MAKKVKSVQPDLSLDRVIQVDFRKEYDSNMTRYSLYALYNRFVPDIHDGLKPVQRRILYSMYDNNITSKALKRKSASTVGDTMGKYHPHGDSSIYDAMKHLTNWFEIKMPLLCYDSNSGSIQGGEQAAYRYTESYLSKFAVDCVLGELAETKTVVDFMPNFDNKKEEPEYLPVKVPLGLVNGCFAIAIGEKIEGPKHALNDVIDETIKVLHNPNHRVVLIPDPCHVCEVVDTDWKAISRTGYGYYTQRGIIQIENCKDGHSILHILSTPDLVFANGVLETINKLIAGNKLTGIVDIRDRSTDEQLDIELVLKAGVDPMYVKHALYSMTSLQDKKRVNLKVIDGVTIKNISYTQYIQYFLLSRKAQKYRLYTYRLQDVATKYHRSEAYIAVLKSGKIEEIVRKIRNRKEDNDAIVDWLMNLLKITDLQALYILHSQLVSLSPHNLKRYEEEAKINKELMERFMNIITSPALIDQEIEQELLEIRQKYDQPRRSVLISDAEASDIPDGVFKIAFTENNFVKKLQPDEMFKPVRGDNCKAMVIGNNSKSLLVFDKMGKVFALPIHKIGFSDKNSPGIDIRLILKKLTSDIVNVLYLPEIEKTSRNPSSNKYFLVVLAKSGLIKKIDLADIITATPSGLIYSKISAGDEVCGVYLAKHNSDLVIYNKQKALRITMNSVPYMKRATLGNMSLKSSTGVDGLSIITPEIGGVVVVTAKGRFNKLSESVLARSDRNKSGSAVIKLSKGDYIVRIVPCIDNTGLRIYRPDEIIDIPVNDIPLGSSISGGTKMTKEGILKVDMLM